MTDVTYICADTWGRARDGSVWIDVPARMIALGHPPDDRAARQRFGRRALRELRARGVDRGLIVAKVDGMGHR